MASARGAGLVAFLVWLALAVLPCAARADETQRAKELFNQGTTLFNLGDFDKAIEAWQEGYKAKPDPGFLYNIGQAYRLKGDATKAIFFYRGYLRNSPKAPNRAEIEAKIAALQKETSEPKAAPAPVLPPPAPPPVAPAPRVAPQPVPPPAPGPPPLAPPPVVAPPLAGPAPEAPEPMTSEPPPPPAAPGGNRPWDAAIGLGFDHWSSGLNIKGNAPSQFAFDLRAGYTFGSDVFGGFSFRLGALIGSTTIDEGAGATKNTLTFTSILVEPSVRVRLIERRLYLTGAIGLGALSIGGVKPTSVVLDPKVVQQGAKVNGSIGAFESRFAIGLQLHFTPGLFAFVSPAISNSPKPTYFYQSLGRVELMFGLGYLF